MEGININNRGNNNIHKQINIKNQNIAEAIKLIIADNEKLININIYANVDDDFNVYMVSPSKLKTNIISSKSRIIKNIANKTKIKGSFKETKPPFSKRKIEISISSEFFIESGVWKVIITPINVTSEVIDIFLLESISKETKFIDLSEEMTVTVRDIDYKNNCTQYGCLKSDVTYFRDLTGKDRYLNDYINKAANRQSITADDVIKNNIEGFIPRFGVRHSSEFQDEFKKLGELYKFVDFSDNLGIIFVEKNTTADLKQIYKLKGLIRLEEIAKLALLGEVRESTVGGISATTEIGADYIKDNPYLDVSGKGVIIGIIDTGIDYLHKDFIYPDGTSKVVYLWDQTKQGNFPKGYLFGTEYAREDINKAIKNNDSSLSKDEVGHGTMISGICAGLGNINKEYAGIAGNAELIVVKAAKINGYYDNVILTTAIQYIYQKAVELSSPVIINMSLGSNFSIGLNSRLLFNEEIFPYLARGFFLIAGAGNEGNTATHAMGKLQFSGEYIDVEIEISDEEEELEIQILANKPDKIIVSIISPTGEESKRLDVVNYSEITGIFDLERSVYKITYIYPTAYSGQQESRVKITKARKGIWKIRLHGEYIINGVYHMFLPNRVFLNNNTKFRQPNPNYTINFPAELKEVLAIGAYDTINKGIWASLSRGPTISGVSKPCIVSPGVNIIGPYPGNKYGTVTGTSAASAHVSGALALYLQYVLIDKIYPDRAFIQQARTYLKAGADRSQTRIYPNDDYGYGVLNIRGLFEQLK